MSRILVVGELNADLVMTGLPTLPVLGRELLGDGFYMAMGSSSAITAARLAALGAAVDFIGLIGNDELGRFVVRELSGFGVGIEHVQVVEGATTDVTIALTYAHDRALLTYAGLMTTFDGAAVTASRLSGHTHLHVGSFFLQTKLQPALPHLFRLAHESGLTTSLDPGWDPRAGWMGNPHLPPTLAETDIFLPNEQEAAALLGDEEAPHRLASRLRGVLVIKRGARGALALKSPRDEPVAVPAFPVDVVDTTGAGDAFNAGFLYATLVMKADLGDALTFAAACGAQAVTQVGGATHAPDAATILAWLRARNPASL